jgi:signal peptidase II
MVAARKTKSRRFAATALMIGFAVCVVDAASKAVAVADLSPHRSVVLLGGLLSLNVYRNPGAAFGIGASYTAIYALIAAAVLATFLRVYRRLRNWPWAIALGLLLGGAAGNLLDRIFRSPGPLHGFVVDWIKLPYFPPIFNIADSAITVGTALLVLASVRGWRLDDAASMPGDASRRPAHSHDDPPTVTW